MQLSWSAVASYCQHENGVAAQHMGHHEHQHQASGHPPDSDETKPAGVLDADCGACHAGCCTALLQSVSLLTAHLPTEVCSASAVHLLSRIASPPDRPNWADLA